MWSVVEAVESAQALLDAVLKGATHRLQRLEAASEDAGQCLALCGACDAA